VCGTVIQGGAEPEPGEQSVVTEGDFVLDDITDEKIIEMVEKRITGITGLEEREACLRAVLDFAITESQTENR
jgi:hypothetical protein